MSPGLIRYNDNTNKNHPQQQQQQHQQQQCQQQQCQQQQCQQQEVHHDIVAANNNNKQNGYNKMKSTIASTTATIIKTTKGKRYKYIIIGLSIIITGLFVLFIYNYNYNYNYKYKYTSIYLFSSHSKLNEDDGNNQ
jgi:hypothetical protein